MRITSFLLLTTILLFGCKDDDSEPAMSPQDSSNYMPLAVGNYWVYDRYSVDSNGEASLSGQDSVTVVAEVEIDGHIYFEFEGSNLITPPTMRDSSGFLVSLDGTILFSYSIFDEPLQVVVDPIENVSYTLTTYMNPTPSSRSVPAGTFTCLDRIERIDTDEEIAIGDFPKFNESSFSDGVGRVYMTLNYFSSTSYLEYRLVEYEVD